MTKEDKQIIDRAVKEEWRIGDRTRLKRLLEKNLKQYRENVELERKLEQTEKENAELKEKIEVLECDNYNANCNLNLITDQLAKARELLAKWVELFKPKGGNIPPTPIQVETEQFLKDVPET